MIFRKNKTGLEIALSYMEVCIDKSVIAAVRNLLLLPGVALLTEAYYDGYYKEVDWKTARPGG